MPIAESVLSAAPLEHNHAEEEQSLETLLWMIRAGHLETLTKKSKEGFQKAAESQKVVAELYDCIKAINRATKGQDSLDISKDDALKTILKRANELECEIELEKMTYTKEERERLLENIRMTVDEKNTDNDLHIQEMTRNYTGQNEMFNLLKSSFGKLDDIKRSILRGLRPGV